MLVVQLPHHEEEGRVDGLVEEVVGLDLSNDQGNGGINGQGCQVGGQGNDVNDGVVGVLDFSTIIAQQLQNLLPTILAQRAVQKAGALEDEAIRNGSLKRNIERRRNGGEPSRDRNVRYDSKRTRTGNDFATTTNLVRREHNVIIPKCVYCNLHHLSEIPGRAYFNCGHLGHMAKDYRVAPRMVNLVNARNPTHAPGEQRQPGTWKGVYAGSKGDSPRPEHRDGGRFDVVIRMDWLSNHKAKIIYHEKEIVVVRDFLEVFLNDLLGLPPIREIKFCIELIPRAISIVKSSYRLAPFEIEELSGQLKEL
nr:reverse transcriptase domain-containing protein [Tanacetum cinerariifolium]